MHIGFTLISFQKDDELVLHVLLLTRLKATFFFLTFLTPVTGLIRTADTLDREVVGHYWLTVSATDMGTVPLTSWTEVYVEVLDVNDNPPEFSQPVYFGSVLENAPEHEFVLQVAATDVDSTSEGKKTFQIQESQRTYFAIDRKTGKCRTLSPETRCPTSSPIAMSRSTANPDSIPPSVYSSHIPCCLHLDS